MFKASPYVEAKVEESGMHKHGCEQRVIHIAGGNVPEQAPEVRREFPEMDCAVGGDDTDAQFRDWIELTPEPRGYFGGGRRRLPSRNVVSKRVWEGLGLQLFFSFKVCKEDVDSSRDRCCPYGGP